MTDQLIEIGRRITALREVMDMSESDLAAACEISTDELAAYERGERDFSFSFLYNAAKVLGVDVMDIMSGDSPKLSLACMVKKGEGYEIQRRKAYSYKHLAYTFQNKKAEPFLVTVEPKDETPVLHAHDGQEFNYMVSGAMDFFLGDMVYVLEEGDSIYFDSGVPHAMRARSNQTAQFIAVVMK
ncbi:MAG: helix-turn-helix domain-containing protein [Christensenellales bacterium]|jgi:quercetin dioxygenase-like cupin family protein